MATQNMTPAVQPRTQPIVPIIVNQILSCRQPDFQICGTSIHIISLVGIVTNINIQSCEISCIIEDHSGRIKGLIRLESQSEVRSKLAGVKDEKYAKIFGSVRTQNGEKTVMILKMFPVDDLNVVTSHLLQSVASKLEAEADLKQRVSSANTSAAALVDALTTSDEGSNEVEPTFTDFQRLVFNIVKSEDSECGVVKRNVLRQFPSYQGHEVNQALEYLINEGVIYPTIDQDHLKVAVRF